MSEHPVPLEAIRSCLQGVIPSMIATCSRDGIPNVTLLSIVHYVDSERVALTYQFFSKTRANLDGNPFAQVVVVDPQTSDQYLLDLQYLHTETEGSTFDTVRANLDAVASQTGMAGIFRLRGVDIHRVLCCVPFGEIARPAEQQHSIEPNTFTLLDEFVRRLAVCADYADVVRTGLEALEDLFGFTQSILLVADDHGERLFAVSSIGYDVSAAGAEVPIGVGVIGIAAQRRRVVCVPNLARSRTMHAAIRQSTAAEDVRLAESREIPLPGLDRVQSASAVPLIVHDTLTGVLYLESEQPGTFGPADERLLRILGGQLAASLATLHSGSRETGASEPSVLPAPTGDQPLSVIYYQADDSVFVDGAYVIKGVAGRVLWKILREHADDGRVEFTNRELRLDEHLGLPAGNDNLDARLLMLRKRLGTMDCGVGLERVGRGQIALRLAASLALREVQTSGPMRAAHPASDDR